jgi:hypothetical protein
VGLPSIPDAMLLHSFFPGVLTNYLAGQMLEFEASR